jgi:hypothetical protein
MQQESLLYQLFTSHLQSGNQHHARAWLSVDWLTEPVLHVPDHTSSTPLALVGVAAYYCLHDEETSEPGEIQTQAGTAVFFYHNNVWQTEGKLLLNLTPSQALDQLTLQAPV